MFMKIVSAEQDSTQGIMERKAERITSGNRFDIHALEPAPVRKKHQAEMAGIPATPACTRGE